ncbi:MAG: rRNA maturation RNase YbeY [Flammeovirgaceae bacterium]|nr:rRNA maturation RNase YbeY [Flammeovirgaceae bacterium]
MGVIRYFSEGTHFKLPDSRKITRWVKFILTKEGVEFSFINYIFCSDEFLHSLNKKYLSHNDYTDIITFRLNEIGELIESEIYISIDRVIDNSNAYGIPFLEELHRVIAHGVLHLAGYKDKKPAEKALMRKKEAAYLSLRKLSST